VHITNKWKIKNNEDHCFLFWCIINMGENMKAISLLEPWASLIKEGIKKIETRSWKTSYRGELYIHASKKKLTKKDWEILEDRLALLKEIDFKYGHIIAKCKLVDCRYMDEELIKEVKKNKNEYLCGSYEIGRYAWILEDLEVIETPLEAKGQLGIWNYEGKDNRSK